MASMKSSDVLSLSQEGPILRLTLNRPNKRNALNEELAEQLEATLAHLDPKTRAIVLDGAGPHFCSGLDLSEHATRDPFEVVLVSRRWHAIKETMQYGRCPVIVCLHGAVIGGGFELAAAAHIRIADTTAFFQLPEGKRGVFIGGGGSVRIARIIGTSRLTELMLTGRVVEAAEAERIGLAHQLVKPGQALARAMEAAEMVAANAPLVNYMIVQALPRIADMSASDGLFTESLAAGLSQSSAEARDGIETFLARRARASLGGAGGSTDDPRSFAEGEAPRDEV